VSMVPGLTPTKRRPCGLWSVVRQRISANHRRLGGAVDGVPGETNVGGDGRREADDALALPLHDGDGVFRHEDRAEQIHVDHSMEIVEADVGDLLVPQDAGIGMNAVQPAEAGGGQIHGGRDVAFLRHIAEVEEARVAFAGERIGQHPSLVGLDRHGDDFGALPGEVLGAGTADAGRAAVMRMVCL